MVLRLGAISHQISMHTFAGSTRRSLKTTQNQEKPSSRSYYSTYSETRTFWVWKMQCIVKRLHITLKFKIGNSNVCTNYAFR